MTSFMQNAQETYPEASLAVTKTYINIIEYLIVTNIFMSREKNMSSRYFPIWEHVIFILLIKSRSYSYVYLVIFNII